MLGDLLRHAAKVIGSWRKELRGSLAFSYTAKGYQTKKEDEEEDV